MSSSLILSSSSRSVTVPSSLSSTVQPPVVEMLSEDYLANSLSSSGEVPDELSAVDIVSSAEQINNVEKIERKKRRDRRDRRNMALDSSDILQAREGELNV